MIDLHCHLLPGIDDGARDLDVSMAMARMALADGITVTACTPHILPGVYNNTGEAIKERIARLREAFRQAGIALRIVAGADVHVAPDLTAQLGDGRALTLNDSRYLLLEPPHHVLPPRMDDYIFGLQTAGYVPIITHPERLSWVDGHYDLIERLVYGGCLMQLTAGSFLGRFGRRPRHLAERMLEDGLCHLLATDAHNTEQRPPILTEACELVAQRVGAEEAMNLVLRRPEAILRDANASELPPLVQARPRHQEPSRTRSRWGHVFRLSRKTGNVR